MEVSRVNVLGVEISSINMAMALAIFQEWIDHNSRQYVCVTPAHAVMDGYRDPSLRSILNGSGLTTPDGMAIVWLLRLHGARHVGRVYGPDLMNEVCRISVQKGWSHFLFGGEPGVAECLKSNLEQRYQGVRVVGTYSPPFRALSDEEDRELIAAINRASPDIVWVGISSPKQERWMHDHLRKLDTPVMVGVGAAFDFLTGRKPQAPAWIQRMGMEWLFRLSTEPGRLWPRYSQYPLFVILAIAQLAGWRRFPAGE